MAPPPMTIFGSNSANYQSLFGMKGLLTGEADTLVYSLFFPEKKFPWKNEGKLSS